MKSLDIRFWEKVNPDISPIFYNGSRCWEWTGAKTKKGYGSFGYIYGTEYAHRISYIFAFGEIPDGLFVCHGCDNRKCVNPNHLFLGTPKENSEDMVSKGRSIVNEKNPRAKLKSSEVREIRKILSSSSNLSHKEIASMFGVSSATISLIGSNSTWKGI